MTTDAINDESSVPIKIEAGSFASVYASCNADSSFSIPRAFAFRDLALGFLTSNPTSSSRAPIRDREHVLHLSRATYAMDRVHAIPHDAGLAISREYFPKVRPWNKHSDVGPLVSAFFDNDPYYPRPIHGDPLYTAFRDGYLEATSEDDKSTAMVFLKAIEQEQQERQSRRANS